MSTRRAVVAMSALLVSGAVLATAVASTRAAWTDETNFQAEASAGDWMSGLPAFECYSVDYDYPDAQCTVVPRQWQDDPGFYQLRFDVTTSQPEPFRWAVRLNLGITDFPVPPVLNCTPATCGSLYDGSLFPGWVPGSTFFLVGACAGSTAGTLPVAEVRGWATSLPHEDEMVSASNPVENRMFQVYPPGVQSEWGTNEARACPPLPPPPAVVYCYSVTPGVDALCEVVIDEWLVTTGPDAHTVDFHVTTTSATPFQWEVWLDYSIDPTDPGRQWPPWDAELFESGDLCSVWTNSELPEVFGRGRGEHAMVSASDPTDTLTFVSHPAGGSGAELGDATNLCDPSLADAPVRCRIPQQPWIPCAAALTGGSGWQRQFTVSTPSTIGVEWEVRVNASSSVFPFVPDKMSSFGLLATVTAVDCGAPERVVRAVGAHSWNQFVRNDQPQTAQIVGEPWNDGQLFTCP